MSFLSVERQFDLPPVEDVGQDKICHLLVVDDEEADRISIRRALDHSELLVEIDEASSITAARRALKSKDYSCVILDYYLQDGRATHLLRSAESGELPPVVILTSSGSERIAVELIKAGASDYLPKDELTPSRIAQSVRNALRMRQGAVALRAAYENLEQKVVERTRALASAYQELEREMESRRFAEERARRNLEQLALVARMSTMGEMAASIAHELNQPLGAIANYANGVLQRLDEGEFDMSLVGKSLGKIAVQAERAGQILHRLRSFVTAHEPVVGRADVNELLREVAALVQLELADREVAIVFDLDTNLPRAWADAIQVQQVVLNLVRNGVEAVEGREDSGQVTLVTRSASQGKQIVVRVIDNGPGCPPEVLEQIFDPFFTTKNRGMGMGLAISRSIVEAWGGELWVESNAVGGLDFSFTLSTHEEDA